MKTNKVIQVQIINILSQHNNAQSVSEICHQYDISQRSFYSCKNKHLGMKVSQLKQVKDMERELSQYKKIVAKLTFRYTVLKDVNEKKVIMPAEQRELIAYSQ